jgi:DNA adenine methylase
VLRPVVKWAGGKRQILPHLIHSLPLRWNQYYEPFIGGGALFIELYTLDLLRKATIADLNPELVNLYQVVRDRPEDLIQALEMEKHKNTQEAYQKARDTFNQIRSAPDRSLERAVLLLYLNRHGYNGLWRVNRKGEFNVPFGRYKDPRLPAAELIRMFSRMLAQVTICNADFETVVATAQAGDLVYFDPPYQPVSSTASFTAYGAQGFSYQDQVRLAAVSHQLAERGVTIIVSNSDTPEIRDLYEGFSLQSIPANRVINSRGDRRTGAMELILSAGFNEDIASSE